MWTSQVYGHHDKMARTKTHITKQNTEYRKRPCYSRTLINSPLFCTFLLWNYFFLVVENHCVFNAHILKLCVFSQKGAWKTQNADQKLSLCQIFLIIHHCICYSNWWWKEKTENGRKILLLFLFIYIKQTKKSRKKYTIFILVINI